MEEAPARVMSTHGGWPASSGIPVDPDAKDETMLTRTTKTKRPSDSLLQLASGALLPVCMRERGVLKIYHRFRVHLCLYIKLVDEFIPPPQIVTEI